MIAHPFEAKSFRLAVNYPWLNAANLYVTGHGISVPGAMRTSFHVNDCITSFDTHVEAIGFATEVNTP